MRKFGWLSLALFMGWTTGIGHAGTLAYYTFTGATAAPETVAANLTASNFSVSDSGNIVFTLTSQEALWVAAGAALPYASSPNLWTRDDQESAKHYYVELTASIGKAVTITNINYLHLRIPAGPPNVGLSINGMSLRSEELAADVVESVNQPVTGFENLTNTVVIRFEGWGASGNGPYRMDNIMIQGYVADEVTGEVAPTVALPTSTNITATNAVLGGTITDTGDTDVVERGVYWSTAPDFDPETEGTRVWQGGTFGTGAFTVLAEDLPPATTIYFVAYARGVATGTAFSEESSFLTLSGPPAMLAAPSFISTAPGSAEIGGNILADNGDPITRRGVAWSTAANFDIGDATVVDESGAFPAGPFSISATDLPKDERIYYRAFAENALGTTYSDDASFYMPPHGALAFFSFDNNQVTPDLMGENLQVSSLSLSDASPIAFGSTLPGSWGGSGVPYAIGVDGWGGSIRSLAKSFDFTIDGMGGYTITITNISVRYLSTTHGPSTMGFRVNNENINDENVPEGIVQTMSAAVINIEQQTSTTVQIQGWDRDISRTTDGTQDLWISDILVQGLVESPAEPQAVELDIRRSAGAFDFSFPSEMGFSYRLEFATNLVEQPVNWQEIDTVPGDGETRTIIDLDPQDSMRMYRILVE